MRVPLDIRFVLFDLFNGSVKHSKVLVIDNMDRKLPAVLHLTEIYLRRHADAFQPKLVVRQSKRPITC